MLKVVECKLENGLTVWLNEDHSQPKVFGAVVVKAGAKDCPDTGIAHYFEHMMFKGTERRTAEEISKDIAVGKAIDLVKENAVITEVEEKKAEESSEE